MNIFLVGGAVRDKLLNYPYFERDWVVVGSSPKEMVQQGFKCVGKDFPVFLHPKTKDEYALARKERKIAHGYTGFEFDIHHTISLEEDLFRRDLTINAIAQDQEGNIVDPYHGVDDLNNKILRHVSPAFSEDPVRVLRLARFAARYHHLGFHIAEETIHLAQTMVANGELNHLVSERIWKELQSSLKETHPDIFFSVLAKVNALPIISQALNHQQLDTLRQACILTTSKTIRFASLCFSFPEPRKQSDIKQLCNTLKVPNNYRELILLVNNYDHYFINFECLSTQEIYTFLSKCDALRKPDRFSKFLSCCQARSKTKNADATSVSDRISSIENLCNKLKNIDAEDFIKQGFSGADIGRAIQEKRIEIINKLRQ